MLTREQEVFEPDSINSIFRIATNKINDTIPNMEGEQFGFPAFGDGKLNYFNCAYNMFNNKF